MNKVVFVQCRPHIRMYKIAKALNYTGNYKLICLCDYNFFDKELFNDIFNEIYFFRKNDKKNYISRIKGYNKINRILKLDFKKITKTLKIIKPDIINCFSEPYNYIKYILKNVDYPTVLIDGNDFSGISYGIENLVKRKREEEKYCFENIDGICHKGPEFEIDYYRRYGYKINCPVVRWMDNCDEDLFKYINKKKLYEENVEIRLVYTGTISCNPQDKHIYFINLGKQLAKQNIHLHIYPSPWSIGTFEEYLELDTKEEYFHFNNPVTYKQLSKEIAKYDWGLNIHSKEGGHRRIKEKAVVGMGNRIFSYLEAGLPIIASDHTITVRKIVEENKIGFSINDNEINKLGEIIKKHDYSKFKDNVKNTRERLSLHNQVKTLEAFYSEVIKSKYKK